MHRATLTVLALATVSLAAGCGSKSRSTTTTTSTSTVSPLSSATGSPTGSGSTTSGPTGSGPSAATRTPTNGPGAASMLPGPSSQGSRFWYVNDAFGNPFKTHTSAEAQVATELLSLHNQARAQAGLQPLALDGQAERAAKAHAEDMRARNFFDHITPEGWDPGARLRMTGASGYSGFGENIIIGSQTAQAMHDAWMNSPGHRANILSPQFTHVGFGIASSAGPYGVAVFLIR